VIDPARLVLVEDDRGELRRVSELTTKTGVSLRASAPIPAEPRTVWPDTSTARLLLQGPPAGR
jgi:hypothetical protein